MAFDNRDIEIPSPIISMENFYAQNLGPKRKKVCEILRTFNDDAVSIYLAGIVALETPNFPAKQSIVGHCFRELINAIVRSDENALKQQVFTALKSSEFIRNSGSTNEHIGHVVNEIWEKIKPLNNETSKLKTMFIDKNPKQKKDLLFSDVETRRKTQKDIDNIIQQVLTAKGNLDKRRHFNKKFSIIPNEQLIENVTILENYILQLEDPTYIKQKEMLDEILETANS